MLAESLLPKLPAELRLSHTPPGEVPGCETLPSLGKSCLTSARECCRLRARSISPGLTGWKGQCCWAPALYVWCKAAPSAVLEHCALLGEEEEECRW